MWKLHCLHRVGGTSPAHDVWPFHAGAFRARFAGLLAAFGLDKLGFRPYSLRRGGITAYYRRTANLSAAIERGRWSAPKTARIYIVDGLAKGETWSTAADKLQADRWRRFLAEIREWPEGGVRAAHVRAHRQGAEVEGGLLV